jgi:predicted dehydrogenase
LFLRCLPALRGLREALDAGALGELSGAEARFTHPGRL